MHIKYKIVSLVRNQKYAFGTCGIVSVHFLKLSCDKIRDFLLVVVINIINLVRLKLFSPKIFPILSAATVPLLSAYGLEITHLKIQLSHKASNKTCK